MQDKYYLFCGRVINC